MPETPQFDVPSRSDPPSHVLILLDGLYAICRLDPSAGLPVWAGAGRFQCSTRTPDELSIVCEASLVPPGVRHEGGWSLLKVEGSFDFSAVGVVASLAGPLARNGISIFVISTFDTDYLLIKRDRLDASARALAAAGHTVRGARGIP